MQFSAVAVAAALVGAVSAGYYNGSAPVYVTEIQTAYTTYCPGPTTLHYGTKTYTVTEATTLTITDCPITIVKPVTYAPVVTVKPTPPVYANTTAPAVPTYAAPSGSPVESSKPVFTGAANRAVAGSAASLAGLLGIAAYIL